MNRPEPLRAIILARVSTTHAEQDTSTERQIARLDELARARGWRVVRRVVERESGTRVIDRPAVAAALDDVLANRADLLVVDHLWRLGRNTREVLQVVDTLAAAGGGFVDASNTTLDTTGPLGRMVLTIFAAIGELAAQEGRRKIREGLARARKRGRVLGRARVVPLAILERARVLRAEIRANGNAPSWAEVVLLLQAETGKRYSRGAISAGVWRLQELGATTEVIDGAA